MRRRWRTPFAEVDLFFRKAPGRYLMVEVKSLGRWDFLVHRIGPRQKARLLRARDHLQSVLNARVELNWAFVRESGDILVIEDVCD